MNMIGYYYMQGFGVEQDYAKAIEWHEKGIEKGNDSALCNLAYHYQNGYGVEQDGAKAIEYFERVIANGKDEGL